MLTHSPAAAEGSHYYTEGRYYHADGHAPAEWSGEGAKALHREGAITDFQEFDRGLGGTLPDGTRLPDPPGGKERRHGDDWTFSPPKSVSLVALVGRDERVVAAHDRAVREAVRYMEREFFGTRGVVDGGQVHVPGGAVVGLFRHETSRPVGGVVDPQLHTHTVWLNAALREDGEWRATDWSLAEGARYTANSVYLSELAADLRRCGYELIPTRDAYEVQGIPRKALGEFGRRAGQIEQELAKAGKTRETSSREERQKANLCTREGKEKRAKEVQRSEWDQRARSMRLDLGRLVGECRFREEVGTREHESGRAVNAGEAMESASRHLSERSAVFTKKDLAAQALKTGAVMGVVLGDLDPALTRSETLVATGDGLFATRETLTQEAHMLGIVREGRANHSPLMSDRDATTLIERQESFHGTPLTKGQSKAVRYVLTSPDLVTVVEGRAGTGKTVALDTVREGLEQVGHHPLGLAPSAVAARRLSEGAGVEAHTPRLVAGDEGHPSPRLPRGRGGHGEHEGHGGPPRPRLGRGESRGPGRGPPAAPRSGSWESPRGHREGWHSHGPARRGPAPEGPRPQGRRGGLRCRRGRARDGACLEGLSARGGPRPCSRSGLPREVPARAGGVARPLGNERDKGGHQPGGPRRTEEGGSPGGGP